MNAHDGGQHGEVQTISSGTVSERPVAPHHLPRPSRLRLTAILIPAIYPLITCLLYALAPLTAGWETWHRTLVITPVMVLLIVFIVTPAVQRHFGWYVARMPRPRRERT